MATLHEDITRLVDREHDLLHDPFELWSDLQADDAPAVFSEAMGAWLVTRRDLVLEVLRDTDNWSSRLASSGSDRNNMIAAAMGELVGDPDLVEVMTALARDRDGAAVLLAADPPHHVRQRRAVNRAFRPSRIRSMEPMVSEISTRLLDDFVADGSVEFVHAYAVLLPMEIIARALGVDSDDLLRFKRWSDDMAIPVGNAAPTVDEVRRFLVSSHEFNQFFSAKLAERAADPRDDIISDVATAEVDGEALTLTEQRSMCQQFLVAGNETTTKLLTNLVHRLAIDPALQERVRADRGLVDPLVEEVLRYEAPVQGLFRNALRDLDFHGITIREGEPVWCVFSAANRDESHHACPHEIRLDRTDEPDHLAFGHGEHFCIGAALARLEARIAVNHLLDRCHNIELQDGFVPSYENSYLLRGLRRLDLTFEPA
ncbi:MAG: cytochrome P450 [Actinomycetota bacterium]